jgi:hypothetical protein
MTKRIESVERLLGIHGPMLTSDISAIYRDQGLSASAARQRVSRRSDVVKTLHGLPFPKNSKFLYLEGAFGDQNFINALIKKLEETSPAYSSAMSGLTSRQGICLRDNWDIVSGSPVLQKGHISSEEVLKRLKSVKLLSETSVAGVGDCVIFAENVASPTNYAAFRARLTLEHILIDIVKDWSVRMGFSSTNTIAIRNGATLPKFSTHCFDIVGPSYLHSLTKKKTGSLQNGFFIADIIWQDDLNKTGVSGFLRKVSTLTSLRNLGKFQSMLVSNSFTKDALMFCRSKGVMAVTPDTLLGRDVAQALLELLDTLERAAAVAIKNPEKIQAIFDKLSIITGLSGNLRGALFEMIIGNMVKALHAGSIDIGEIVTDPSSKGKADIDVRLVKQDAIICYECKGYASHRQVTLDEVKYWLEKQVPIIRASQKYEQRFNNKDSVFEFWTTGSFEEEALKYLDERKQNINKYEINWRDGEYVLEEAKKLNTNTIAKILKTHYFNQTPSAVLEIV